MSGVGGMIRKRSDGRWEGRYVGPDGRKHSVYARKEGDVRRLLREAVAQSDAGLAPVSHRLTVAAYLDRWLADSVEPRLRPRTVDSYRETCRRYIAPAIGGVAVAKLERAHIQRMVADLTARGDLSPTTVRYAYSVLRIALGRAVKDGVVHRNVAELVDPPRKSTVEMRPLTGEQVRHFLDATADDRFGPLYALAVATGMRQGELLALRWDDVDLEARTLDVRHSLQRRSRVLAEPKTQRGRRRLVLGESALDALRTQASRQRRARIAAGRSWHDEGLIFTTGEGRPLDGANVTHGLQVALERLGLPRQRFHDLRHAHATLMLEAGEELAVISRTLGHADLSTTADIYSHLTRAMQERSAARMDSILAPRRAVVG